MSLMVESILLSLPSPLSLRPGGHQICCSLPSRRRRGRGRCAGRSDKNLLSARPPVLSAARVKENCFSLSFIVAPSCESWRRVATNNKCRVIDGFAPAPEAWTGGSGRAARQCASSSATGGANFRKALRVARNQVLGGRTSCFSRWAGIWAICGSRWTKMASWILAQAAIKASIAGRRWGVSRLSWKAALATTLSTGMTTSNKLSRIRPRYRDAGRAHTFPAIALGIQTGRRRTSPARRLHPGESPAPAPIPAPGRRAPGARRCQGRG